MFDDDVVEYDFDGERICEPDVPWVDDDTMPNKELERELSEMTTMKCIEKMGLPKIYYAHFDSVHGFRIYKIVADTDAEAKHIALAYDKDNTISGDRLIIYLAGRVIINEVM